MEAARGYLRSVRETLQGQTALPERRLAKIVVIGFDKEDKLLLLAGLLNKLKTEAELLVGHCRGENGAFGEGFYPPTDGALNDQRFVRERLETVRKYPREGIRSNLCPPYMNDFLADLWETFDMAYETWSKSKQSAQRQGEIRNEKGSEAIRPDAGST